MLSCYFGLQEQAAIARVAILIKTASFKNKQIQNNYVMGNPNNYAAFSLDYPSSGNCSVAHQKGYLAELLPVITGMDIHTVLVADSAYFKTLAGKTKADLYYGHVLKCAIKGYEHINVILAPNYQAILYNPALQLKLDLANQTVINFLAGTYAGPGKLTLKNPQYPQTIEDITLALARLHQYKSITCDIETRGLKFYNCGISTIAFAWNQCEGLAFAIDRHKDSEQIRLVLRAFFTRYKGKIIYHNATFDIKVLVYQLWMQHLADYIGMQKGIEILHSNCEDTKIITYLATNNTVENVLKLKVLSREFAGNYALEDITDTEKVPLPKLLEYNLTDACCTWYVADKYTPKMIADDQLNTYEVLFKPGLKVILQMELSGMPIDPTQVQNVKATLKDIVKAHKAYIANSPIVNDCHYQILQEKVTADNLKLKTKVRVIEDFAQIKFNPHSDKQLQRLIYDYLGYEPIDFTKGGFPSTGVKTLAKLLNFTKCEEHTLLLEAFIGLSQADKILTSFIPAFEQAQQLPDGSWRLYGNFNLGGTQSGRLSSSEPNLTNIPSNSIYAKLVKQAFISPFGYIFCGSDFDSLEDKVNALLTRDPNKMAVYEHGYDGHCLRTFYYFREQLPNVSLPEDTDRCFKLNINGQELYCKSGDFVIDATNKRISVEEYYAACCKEG